MWPFQQVSCDLITGLSSFSGFDALLVLVDHGLTKGVILCPTKTTVITEGIASLFFHKVYLHFGLYDKIISNHGLQFASAFAQELGKLLDYDLSLSMAYHPQFNGEMECINHEVETYLCIFCGNHPISWSESISHTKFAHNHCVHSVTNQFPFFLMMEYKSHALPTVIPTTSIPAIEIRLKQLTAARDEALAAHELVQQVMASHTQQHFTPFTKGQKVWLEAKNLQHSVVNPKFAPKWEALFVITKVLSLIVYQLWLPPTWKIHPTFHTSLLSSYCENDIHGPNFPNPPPDLIDGEEEYEIEWILQHHRTPSFHSFLI